jgi:hypothetical protein
LHIGKLKEARLQMTEADRIFSAHGVASVDFVKGQIEKALVNGDEAEALRLDSLLQEIEDLVKRSTEMR